MAEYIERDVAKQKAKWVHGKWDDTYLSTSALLSIPAADVAPVVHGRWLDGEDYVFCSKCGIQWNYCDNDTQDFNYCPNCGAKMDEEDDV